MPDERDPAVWAWIDASRSRATRAPVSPGEAQSAVQCVVKGAAKGAAHSDDFQPEPQLFACLFSAILALL